MFSNEYSNDRVEMVFVLVLFAKVTCSLSIGRVKVPTTRKYVISLLVEQSACRSFVSCVELISINTVDWINEDLPF